MSGVAADGFARPNFGQEIGNTQGVEQRRAIG
jgi:hypothetical protein